MEINLKLGTIIRIGDNASGGSMHTHLIFPLKKTIVHQVQQIGMVIDILKILSLDISIIKLQHTEIMRSYSIK